jgi:hypothetical protein
VNIIWPDVNVGTIGISSLLMLLIVLFARGIILSRRTADQEQRALIAGHEAKDEAHEEALAMRNEQIAELRERERRKDDVIDRQSAQITLLLEEVAASLRQWSNATEIAVQHVGDGDST